MENATVAHHKQSTHIGCCRFPVVEDHAAFRLKTPPPSPNTSAAWKKKLGKKKKQRSTFLLASFFFSSKRQAASYKKNYDIDLLIEQLIL